MPPTLLGKYHNELILQASCQVVANSASAAGLEATGTPIKWRDIIIRSMKHKGDLVRESAASAMAAASELIDCSGDVKR